MINLVIKRFFHFSFIGLRATISLLFSFIVIYALSYVFLIHQIIRDRQDSIFFGFDLNQMSSLPIIGKPHSIIESSYAWLIENLQNSLGIYYLEIIFLLPIGILLLETISNIRLHETTRKFLQVWLVITAYYGFFYFFTSDKSLLSFTIILIPAGCVAALLKFANKDTGRYSIKRFLRGLPFYSKPINDGTYSHLYLRQSLIVLYFLLFWFQVALSPSSTAQIYYVFISSSLVVIGFVALIFTYAHEKMDSLRVRENIEADTNTIYRVVGLVILSSLTGLLLFSEQNISFVLNNEFDYAILATSVFMIACTGAILSIEATIITFSLIAANLPSSPKIKGKFTILFDERRQQPTFNVMAETDSGWSELRLHLIDHGYEVLPFEATSTMAFRKYKKVAIVIQACASGIDDEAAHYYKHIVESGSALIVFVDNNEIATKSSLFKTFEIEEDSIIALQAEKTMNVFLADDKEHPWAKYHLTIDTGSPLAFEEISGLNPVVSINLKSQEDDKLRPVTFIGSKPIGEGLFIVVGDIAPWSNKTLRDNNALECLDAILDRASTVLN